MSTRAFQLQFTTDFRAPGQADVILANSKFTARVFKTHLPSIPSTPKVVYPGINLSAYEASSYDTHDQDILDVVSYVLYRRRSVYCTEVHRRAETAPPYSR